MRRVLSVLNVEDSEKDASLIEHHLTQAGYNLTFDRVDTAGAMTGALDRRVWDVILADYSMPAFSGLKALELLQGTGKDVPFIIISGTIGEEIAVEAMLAGADDYLMKDNLARLVPAIERELGEAKSREARRQAEREMSRLNAEIERQRDRLNTIVANVPGIVWETWGQRDAAAPRVDFVSDYVKTMLGYSTEEWLASPNFWLSIVHPEDQEETARNARSSIVGGRKSALEFRWIDKSGKSVWVESNAVAITDDKGSPIGMRGVTVDITDRRRAEKDLRESEERYRLLFDRSPHPTYVVDKETHLLLAVNEAAAERYGYSRQELLLATVEEICTTAEIEWLKVRASQAPSTTQQTGHWKHRRKDGTTIDVESTVRELVYAGRPAFFVFVQEVAERGALEEQFRHSQRMEAVGQVANGIAHDLKNVLTIVNGLSSTAMSTVKTSDPLRRDLELIKEAGNRAAGLTRKLLELSHNMTRAASKSLK